jgi:hypothetical protein
LQKKYSKYYEQGNYLNRNSYNFKEDVMKIVPLDPSNDLIEKIREDFLYNADKFQGVLSTCCTWDDSMVPSHMMLQLFYISNHAAGGDNGDGSDHCRDLVAFLSNPFTRICISFVAELYPFHCKVARFLNGKSAINMTKVISTRMLEAPIFYRRILKYMNNLCTDWKSVLTNTALKLEVEIARANQLQLPHADSIGADIENRISSVTRTVWDLSVKYMQTPFLSSSFSILLPKEE